VHLIAFCVDVFGPNAMNTGMEAGNVNFSAERLSAMLLQGQQAGPVSSSLCVPAIAILHLHPRMQSQGRQRAPSWEETLTITSSANIRRTTLKLVQEDSPQMQAALGRPTAYEPSRTDGTEPLSPAGTSSSIFLSFKVDCDRPARVTVLYGVTRRTLSLTGVTTQVAFRYATPSLLLGPGLEQHITPSAIAAAIASAPGSPGQSLREWCWDCAPSCHDRELQFPPLAPEAGEGEAAMLHGERQADTPLGKFTDHTCAALVLLESGEGMQWDSADLAAHTVHLPQAALTGQQSQISTARIVGLQKIDDSLLRVLPCAPPLGSPLQVHCTSVQCTPRPQAPRDSGALADAPHTTPSVDVQLNDEWRFSCSVLEQHLQVEGQCFQLQEIYGIDALQKQSEVGNTDTALADDALCLICLTEARGVMMLPCRHVCLCSACAQEMRGHANFNCPVCRADVHTLMQIRQDATPAATAEKSAASTGAQTGVVSSSVPAGPSGEGEGGGAAATAAAAGPPAESDSAV